MIHIHSKKPKYSIAFLLILLSIVGLTLNSSMMALKSSNFFKVNMSTNGYPEVDVSFVPDIDYELLHDMWYNPKIEMLIICPNRSDFIDALKPLMDWKNEKGVKTIILSNFSLYEGRDDAEKIRNMIKSYYEKENIQWVLLAGDAQENLIPIRMVYNPDVLRWGGGRTESISGEYYKPTDFYYADLSGSWDSDEDNIWGEAPRDNLYGLDEISWTPEVYVGRFPANDANELEIMVNKTLKYEKNPQIGDWMNRMLLTGGISSYSVSGQDSGEYESALTNFIIQHYAQYDINYSHLVKEEGNLTRSNLKAFFNNGYSTVIMAGHGAPTVYYIDPSTIGYSSSDAASSSNAYMPSLVYIDACSTSSYDANDNSIGETLIKRINGGAIGAIGGLRVTWYFEDDENLEKLNRGNAKMFWKEFFQEEKFQQGKALYDSKVSYINSDYYTQGTGSTRYDFERKNILSYNLLGDPEVDIYTNIPQQAANPFYENIYEGQLASITIMDIHSKTIPFARVYFTSSDGKFNTVYADKNGITKFRLPALANETYNVTVTGHNLIPTHFNFTTLPDTSKPEFIGIECIPKSPMTSDTINFKIEILDNYSGIESVHLLLSDNNFESYEYFSRSNGLLENQNLLTFNLNKVKPGDYSYCIISRDYANNSNIFQDLGFKLIIPTPIMDYILPMSLILIIGITGLSVFLIFKEIRRYARINDN